MQLSTKVAYNTLIQIISKIIATALGLVAVAMMTRYLGKEGFGQYTAIITFLSFFGIMADLGLTLVTVQMISKPNINQDKILGNLFSLRLISALVFLGFAPLVVLFFPYNPIIKIGVAIATGSFLFVALNQILVGLFQKNLRMDKVSIAEVANRIILVVGIYIVYKIDKGLIGLVVVTVLSSAVSFILHYIFSRSFARLKLCFNLDIYKEILKKSWPLALTIFFNLLYLKTDTLLLTIIKRPSEIGIIAEVGLYGAAYKVIDILITFPFMFAGIILPILTLRWSNKDNEGFKKILQKSFDILMIMAVPLVVGTQFLAKKIMVLVAGQEFAASGAILQILILAAFFIFFGNMFSHAIIAINKQKKLIWLYVFVAITSVAGYFIFIPRFSYFGAAWMTIYSELLVAFGSTIIAWKLIGFFPNFKVFTKSLLASIIMGVTLYFLKINNLVINLSVAILVYGFFLYLFRGLTKKDVLILFNK